MKKLKFLPAIISFALLFSLVSLPSHSQTVQIAPVMPEIERNFPPGCGFIPPRMDLSHLHANNAPGKIGHASAVAEFDWRDSAKITSIRYQSTCGACYAFASLAVVESRMLLDGEGTFDFSENNAKECNWYDVSCSDGNSYKMANWLSKEGTVLETCDPYVAANVACKSTCTYSKTVLDWCVISSGSVPSTAALKDYILNNGPVYSTLYAGNGDDWETEFQSYDGSYTLYYAGADTPNHAIMIIGWDDNLNHTGGTGAWIVKNSWGTSWGGTCGYGAESGYFTIAYGSANIGQYSAFMNDWQDYDENGEILYYDEGGYTTAYGYGDQTAWGMCKYVLSDNLDISRVELWTTDITTDIDIYIYDDFDGSALSNLLASKLNVSFTESGYHSAQLSSAIEVLSGEDIYVAVKITNSSYTFPVAADHQGPSESGKCYLSFTGGSGTWGEQSYDLCIRVRGTGTLALDIDDDQRPPREYGLIGNYPNPFNLSTIIDYKLETRSQVNITIYNLLGQEINTIVDDVKSAGMQRAFWDGRDYNGQPLSSGVYYYRIKTDAFEETKKMLLLK